MIRLPSYDQENIYVPTVDRAFYNSDYRYDEENLILEAISSILLYLNPPLDTGNGHLETHLDPTAQITFRVFEDGAFFDMALVGRKRNGVTKFNVAFVSPDDVGTLQPKNIDPDYD